MVDSCLCLHGCATWLYMVQVTLETISVMYIQNHINCTVCVLGLYSSSGSSVGSNVIWYSINVIFNTVLQAQRALALELPTKLTLAVKYLQRSRIWAMALTSLLLALIVICLDLSAATNFRGAIVQWRAVDPVNFDGRVSKWSMRV